MDIKIFWCVTGQRTILLRGVLLYMVMPCRHLIGNTVFGKTKNTGKDKQYHIIIAKALDMMLVFIEKPK